MAEKKKKNMILRIISWIFAVLIVLIIIAVVQINPIAKSLIVNAGSAQTGVQISLDSINISLLRGRVEIRNLIVDNPEGYSSDHAILLGTVNAEIDPWSLLGSKLIIHELTLKNINVNFETKLLTNNISAILDNVNSKIGSSEKSGTSEKSSTDEEGKKMQIDYLVVENVGAHLVLSGVSTEGAGVAVTIQPMRDLGRGNDGITPGELIARVLTAFLTDSQEQGILTVSGSVEDSVRELNVGSLKSLLGGKDDKDKN